MTITLPDKIAAWTVLNAIAEEHELLDRMPACKNCRHWLPLPCYGGHCHRIGDEDNDEIAHVSSGGALFPSADFYCALFEAKE